MAARPITTVRGGAGVPWGPRTPTPPLCSRQTGARRASSSVREFSKARPGTLTSRPQVPRSPSPQEQVRSHLSIGVECPQIRHHHSSGDRSPPGDTVWPRDPKNCPQGETRSPGCRDGPGLLHTDAQIWSSFCRRQSDICQPQVPELQSWVVSAVHRASGSPCVQGFARKVTICNHCDPMLSLGCDMGPDNRGSLVPSWPWCVALVGTKPSVVCAKEETRKCGPEWIRDPVHCGFLSVLWGTRTVYSPVTLPRVTCSLNGPW
jgi:hypothetical protein